MKKLIQSILVLSILGILSITNTEARSFVAEGQHSAAVSPFALEQQDPQADKQALREAKKREKAQAKLEKERAKAQKERERAVKRLEKAQKKVSSLERKVASQSRKVERLKNSFYVKLNRGRLTDIDEQKEKIKISKEELKLRELERDLQKAIEDAGRLR